MTKIKARKDSFGLQSVLLSWLEHGFLEFLCPSSRTVTMDHLPAAFSSWRYFQRQIVPAVTQLRKCGGKAMLPDLKQSLSDSSRSSDTET